MRGTFNIFFIRRCVIHVDGPIRIVKEFYLKEKDFKRPKIFGMTASPVDAKVDVVKAAR